MGPASFRLDVSLQRDSVKKSRRITAPRSQLVGRTGEARSRYRTVSNRSSVFRAARTAEQAAQLNYQELRERGERFHDFDYVTHNVAQSSHA
jgi:hypothetical protein